MRDITFSLIEIFVSLVVETIILGGLFTWVNNKSAEKMENKLKDEIRKLEKQNTLIYEEISNAVHSSRNDIISQIKESNG